MGFRNRTLKQALSLLQTVQPMVIILSHRISHLCIEKESFFN